MLMIHKHKETNNGILIISWTENKAMATMTTWGIIETILFIINLKTLKIIYLDVYWNR